MSQHHLRHEKNCLNCGATVEDRYCSRCGQENIEPKESVGHLIGHFFADITHFDSKLFTTLKDLVFRPGFLTREYALGRRTRYLNPIRMYVFISAIFFLVLYSGNGQEGATPAEISGHGVNLFRQQFADSLRNAAGSQDSEGRAAMEAVAARLDTPQALKPGDESASLYMSSNGSVEIDIVENKYNSIEEYQAAQAKLPDSSRNHGVFGWIVRNDIRLKRAHGGRSMLHMEVNVQHTIPKLMFVLLPLFALFVSLFYRRKRYPYTQHAIFSIHYHSFFFLMMLLALVTGNVIHSPWVEFGFPTLVLILAFLYLVAALRRTYGGGLWRSLAKGVAITALYSLAIVISLSVVAVATFFWT